MTRLLFESGARVSEVTGVSLGGWQALGRMTQARVINKGSRGRPVKTLVFRKDTAKRLQRYFDGERRTHDPRGWGLQEYISACQSKQVDLWNVPIFLTEQSTPYTAKNFRDHYWSPASRAAGLNLDVHQARHWYVTMRIRWIYETRKTAKEIDDERTKLKEYMAWARGDAMLDVYDAHVKEARRMEHLTEFHAYMDSVLKNPMRAQCARIARRVPVDHSWTPVAGDLESEQSNFRNRRAPFLGACAASSLVSSFGTPLRGEGWLHSPSIPVVSAMHRSRECLAALLRRLPTAFR